MTLQVTMERDGHDQPWGFRLQGGVDVGLPLSVLRVLVGTPAELVLKKGDVLSKIGTTGTNNLSHQHAVDLFNTAGNQLNVTVKRGGVVAGSSQPSISSLQASVAIKQQQHEAQQAAAAIELQQQGDPTQTQKVVVEAASDHQRGLRSPPPLAPILPVLDPAAPPKAAPLPAVIAPPPAIFSPAPAAPAPPQLVVKQYSTAASAKHVSTKQCTTGMINPGKLHQSAGAPPQIILTPNKDYNPTESATWQLLADTDPNPPSLEKLEKFLNPKGLPEPDMNEHDPIFSEVYSSPKVPTPGQKPARSPFPGSASPNPVLTPKAGSPRPQNSGTATPTRKEAGPAAAVGGDSTAQGGAASAVQAAALAADTSDSRGRSPKQQEPIPIYETNSIGGHKRIAQSSSFNKLMMSLLSED